jgi:hypothetical protein
LLRGYPEVLYGLCVLGCILSLEVVLVRSRKQSNILYPHSVEGVKLATPWRSLRLTASMEESESPWIHDWLVLPQT